MAVDPEGLHPERANCYLIQCQPGPTLETARHAGAKPFARLNRGIVFDLPGQDIAYQLA